MAVRSTAAVYSYCKSRGLYAGVSLVGSYLIERKDTNRKYVTIIIRHKNWMFGCHLLHIFSVFVSISKVCFTFYIRFYGQDIRASAILNGDVEPPPEAHDLYTILEDYRERYATDWQSKYMKPTINKQVNVCALLPGS